MAEKVFEITRKVASDRLEDLQNINKAVIAELAAGNPVYATIVEGRFKGTIARVKLGKNSPTRVGSIFTKSDGYGVKIAKDHIWELEVDGSNRTFHINWYRVLNRDYGNKTTIRVFVGRTDGTQLVRVDKGQHDTLRDFLGSEILDGDYVLMYNTPWELKAVGSPFRMLRYTGKRSDKQAQFTYVKMGESSKNFTPEGGQTIRVGLNSQDGKSVSNSIYGVKVDVDSSLATAMQMVDHDMSIFPLKFHVGLADD